MLILDPTGTYLHQPTGFFKTTNIAKSGRWVYKETLDPTGQY